MVNSRKNQCSILWSRNQKTTSHSWGMRSCTAWRRICPWKAMMVISWEPIASCLSASWKEKIEDVRNSHSWQKFNLCRQQKNYATEIWHRCQKWWEKVSGFKHGNFGVSMLNFRGVGIVTQISDKLLLFSEPGDQSWVGVPSLELTYPQSLGLNFRLNWSIFRGRSFMFGGVTSFSSCICSFTSMVNHPCFDCHVDPSVHL